MQGVNGESLGEGVFAARPFASGEHLELFAFGKLTSKVAYEVRNGRVPNKCYNRSGRKMFRKRGNTLPSREFLPYKGLGGCLFWTKHAQLRKLIPTKTQH